MRVITQATEFSKIPGPIILAAGFFDGLHKGHQLVVGSSVRRARDIGGQAWVLTFDRHPLAVLAPSKRPPLINTLEQRLALMDECGVAGVFLLKFTRSMAVLEPEIFVRRLCGLPRTKCATRAQEQKRSGLSEVRCGDNWRFGRRGSGNPTTLADFGAQYGFEVVIVPYAEYKGSAISSTRVRLAIQEGRLGEAQAMLGRPYTLSGTVMHGRGVGKTLQAATANLCPQAEVLPPKGVYVVRARVADRWFKGVANFGVCPTFEDQVRPLVLEVHLLDFTGDLYGQHLEVEMLQKLRDEIRFTSSGALAAQIAQDIQMARNLF